MAKTLEERFWGKVDKLGPVPAAYEELGECWVWTRGKQPRGQGSVACHSGRHWELQRIVAGSNNPRALLTESQVARIKSLICEGEATASIARQFGVRPAVVSFITTGATWSLVPWPEGASLAIDRPGGKVSTAARRKRRLASAPESRP